MKFQYYCILNRYYLHSEVENTNYIQYYTYHVRIYKPTISLKLKYIISSYRDPHTSGYLETRKLTKQPTEPPHLHYPLK